MRALSAAAGMATRRVLLVVARAGGRAQARNCENQRVSVRDGVRAACALVPVARPTEFGSWRSF